MMSDLRILHLLANFEIGGAELVALRLAGAQEAAGHTPFIVGFEGGPLIDRAKRGGLDSFVMHKGARFDAKLPFRLAQLLRNERIDVIHSHNPMGLVYAAPAAKLARVASVHTKHGEGKDIARRMLVLRAAGRIVGRFVCVSSETRDFALHSGEAPSNRVDVIDNGINTHTFRWDEDRRRSIRSELGVGDRVVIGTVGRLNAVKDQALLLRSVAPLLGPDRLLVIAGDGPERSALVRLAADLGVADDVRFLGARSDVEQVLNALDVFALSSRTEGLPLVLLEAMASELPVVSTRVGGIAPVLDHPSSLVEWGDEGAMRSKIEELCDDSEQRRARGAIARKRIEAHYSLKSMHSAYMRVYRGLVRV